MKKIIMFFAICMMFSASLAVAQQSYSPIASYVVPVVATGVTRFFVPATDDFVGAWMTVSSGGSIRYYPRGISGVTPYGDLIDKGDKYWVPSRTEYDSAQFSTDASGSGSSVFVTTYQK
jgi:hypothetical protein